MAAFSSAHEHAGHDGANLHCWSLSASLRKGWNQGPKFAVNLRKLRQVLVATLSKMHYCDDKTNCDSKGGVGSNSWKLTLQQAPCDHKAIGHALAQ